MRWPLWAGKGGETPRAPGSEWSTALLEGSNFDDQRTQANGRGSPTALMEDEQERTGGGPGQQYITSWRVKYSTGRPPGSPSVAPWSHSREYRHLAPRTRRQLLWPYGPSFNLRTGVARPNTRAYCSAHWRGPECAMEARIPRPYSNAFRLS